MSGLIREQQHIIRETHQHVQKPRNNLISASRTGQNWRKPKPTLGHRSSICTQRW
jgi:hypothetical protein